MTILTAYKDDNYSDSSSNGLGKCPDYRNTSCKINNKDGIPINYHHHRNPHVSYVY